MVAFILVHTYSMCNYNDTLCMLFSANKLQISVLRSERDDLERKNLEHVLTSSSVHTNRYKVYKHLKQ